MEERLRTSPPAEFMVRNSMRNMPAPFRAARVGSAVLVLLLSACGTPADLPEHCLVSTADGGFVWINGDRSVVLFHPDRGAAGTGLRAERLGADPEGFVYLDEQAYRVVADRLVAAGERAIPETAPARRERLSAWQGYLARGPDSSESSGNYRALAVSDDGRLYLGGPGIHRLNRSVDAELFSKEIVHGLAFDASGALYAVQADGLFTRLLRIEADGSGTVIEAVMNDGPRRILPLLLGALLGTLAGLIWVLVMRRRVKRQQGSTPA